MEGSQMEREETDGTGERCLQGDAGTERTERQESELKGET